MLPPEIIIRILGQTDYDTIKKYREFDKKFVDVNIKYLFRNYVCSTHFLDMVIPKLIILMILKKYGIWKNMKLSLKNICST